MAYDRRPLAPATPRRACHGAQVVFGLMVAATSACGADGPGARDPRAATSCDAVTLEACETRLAEAASRGHDARPLALAYVEARRHADDDDAVAAIVRGVPAGDGPLLVVLPGAQVPSGARRVVKAKAVPADSRALGADGWLLAIAHATGTSHVIAVKPGGRRVHALRRDALRPLVAGLLPIFRSAGDRPLADDVAVISAVDAAFEAAGRFDYTAAAEAGDRLGAAYRARPEADGVARRARYALQLLAVAGIVLEAEGDGPLPPPIAGPIEGETPYEALLAVRTATESVEAYRPRRAALATALGATLAPMLDAWVGIDAESEVCPQASVPAFDDDRHLAFAGWLGLALRPAGLNPADARGRVPLEVWYPRHGALHRAAMRHQLGWWAAGVLLTERGATGGVAPSATPTHRAVTELGGRHLRALAQLVERGGGRTGFATVTAVALLPGVREDPELAPLVSQLAQRSTQLAMARAANAGDVVLALVSGISSALTYPPEMQAAQLNALQSAFTAQLRGNLASQKGWAVAGLVAMDAVYRLIAQQGPNLPVSASAVARALEDPSVEQPGLAALAIAASRYGALGATGDIGAPILEKGKDGPRPARAEARRALREALSRLGDGASAPPGAALDDLTDLVDGAVATMVASIASSGAASTPSGAPASTCAATGTSPTTRRALGKLRDVRRRLAASTWFAAGSDVWSQRARLLVLATSDALDVAEHDGENAVFVIDDARAERILRDALGGLVPGGVVDAAVGTHALGRARLAAKSDPAVRARAVRQVVVGLRDALTDESSGGVAGAGVLDVLASDAVVASLSADPARALERDLAPAMLREATRLHAAGDRSRGDVLLLMLAGMSAAGQQGLPDTAIELAERARSRARWVLVERDASARLNSGLPVDGARLRAALKDAVPPACGRATTEMVADVAVAASAFRAGRRDEARTTMRALVERLERTPPVLPRTTYSYRENVGTRVFQATLGMTPSAGLLTSSNSFQAGLGFQSVPMPHTSTLRVSVDPSGAAATEENAGRFTVHVAALAAVYELLGGDPRRAERAAALAYSSATRPLPGLETPLARDGAPALLLAAQLFAEQGRALLAGDLLALVRSTLPEAGDDVAVAEALAAVPLGLDGAKDADEAMTRARKTLAVVAEKLPCTTDKVDLRRFETPRCDAYPTAIALRVADAVPRLPRLAVIDAKSCVHAPLDAFFGKVDGGAYDPDALTRAVESRVALGHGYDAVVLLSRLRQPDHCSPALAGAARALGETDGLPPGIRADAMLTAMHCSRDRVADDALAIDRLLVASNDDNRAFGFFLGMAALAWSTGEGAPLERLTAQPGYHDRWMAYGGANSATTALAVDHAGATMSGRPPRIAETAELHRTLCVDYPSRERAPVCASIEAMRRLDTPLADRKQIAERTMQALAATPSGAGGAP